MNTVRLACLLGLMGLAACRNQDDTMIVVEVTSDMAAPILLDAVRIDVIGPTANSSKLYELSLFENLPVRLALVPDSAKDASLTVKAVGLLQHVEIVSSAVRVAFVPGESKLLRLFLSGHCMNVACGPSETCRAGACSRVPTIAGLPDYPKGSGGMGGQTGFAGNGGRTGGDRGTIVPRGGTTAPSGGTTVPRGGTTVPRGGTTVPLGGTTVPLGGTTVPRGGSTGGIRSSGGSGGSAGSSGGAGSPGGSSGGTCVSEPSCGGDVVGSWEVTSSCLTLDGDFATRGTGLGCNTFKVTGALQVKGSFSADLDRRFQDKTTTTGTVTIKMAKQCLSMAGTWTTCGLIPVAVDGLGFANTRCVDAPDGGCTCSATVKQSGNMGLIVASPETSGTYVTSNNTVVTGENLLTGAQLAYSYCVSNDRLTVTPATTSPPTSGTIVLQKTNANACTVLPAAPAFDIAPLPCEVVAKDPGGAACVAAHSTVRVIVPGYKGPLYQLCKGAAQRGPDSCKGTVQDVSSIDGFADVDAHNVLCANESCTITKIYDQSGRGNHLEPAPKGGARATPDDPAKANALRVVIGGHKAYGLLLKPGVGYRAGCNGCTQPRASGMAQGDEPQTVYMVTSQKDLIDGCCFDYGNAETTCNVEGSGTAEALYFGAGVVWGTGTGGKPGPWVMADLENGLYAGWENTQDKGISTNRPLKFDFVTAVLVGDTADKNSGKGRFALYGADAQGQDASLGKLTCMYDGIRPEKKGYVPMAKQGSIVLGIGGDNSASAGGRFYEGAIIAGPLVSKTTLSFLQAVIVAAKYKNPE